LHGSVIFKKGIVPFSLPFEIPTPDITTNSEQELNNNNTKANLVKDVSLEELKLTIVSPSGKTFSFLKSVHIYISTNDDDEVELAYKDNIESKYPNEQGLESKFIKCIQEYRKQQQMQDEQGYMEILPACRDIPVGTPQVISFW